MHRLVVFKLLVRGKATHPKDNKTADTQSSICGYLCQNNAMLLFRLP